MANKHTIIDEANLGGTSEPFLELHTNPAADESVNRTTPAQNHVAIDDHDANDTIFSDLVSDPVTIQITSLAYLRAMGNLFWSAIRHPLSDTTIDLSTGHVLRRN